MARPLARLLSRCTGHCGEKTDKPPGGGGDEDDDGNAVAFQVKVGDVVLVSKYGGTEVKFDDEVYQLLREDDILGIIG